MAKRKQVPPASGAPRREKDISAKKPKRAIRSNARSARQKSARRRVWVPDVAESLQFALAVSLPKGKRPLNRGEYEHLFEKKLKRIVKNDASALKRVHELAPDLQVDGPNDIVPKLLSSDRWRTLMAHVWSKGKPTKKPNEKVEKMFEQSLRTQALADVLSDLYAPDIDLFEIEELCGKESALELELENLRLHRNSLSPIDPAYLERKREAEEEIGQLAVKLDKIREQLYFSHVSMGQETVSQRDTRLKRRFHELYAKTRNKRQACHELAKEEEQRSGISEERLMTIMRVPR